MAERPDDFIAWAESADAADVDPSGLSGLRDGGWPNGVVPTSQERNYVERSTGRHIGYLTRSAGFFATPGDAFESTVGLADGDTIVSGKSANGDGHPGGSGETSSNSEDFVDVIHDGRFLIALEGSNNPTVGRVRVIDLAGIVADRNWSVNVGTFDVSCIAANGSKIVVGQDNSTGVVLVYDYDGNEQFNFTHGAAVHDVWIDETRVYAVGTLDGSDNAITVHNHITEALDWEYARTTASDPFWSITGDDDFVYVSGLSDATTGHDVYRFEKDGTLDDSISVGTATQETFGSKRLVVGPHSLFMATTSASPGNLLIYEVTKRGDLAVIDVLDLSGETGGSAWVGNLDIDDRFLYVGGTLDYNFAIPHHYDNIDNAWLRARRVGPANIAGRLVTTGQYLHVIHEAAPTNIANVGIGRRPGIWAYRAAPAGWFRRLFVPGE